MIELNLAGLSAAMSGSAAALGEVGHHPATNRRRKGGKVFPSTYAGGKYATEKRRIRDDEGKEREVECVLLNSVQSESNAAELALLNAIERDKSRCL